MPLHRLGFHADAHRFPCKAFQWPCSPAHLHRHIAQRCHVAHNKREQGHVAVEMAFVMSLFIMLLMGVIDVARWNVAQSSALEATRAGARVAVVCDPGAPLVSSVTLAHLVGPGPGESMPSVDVRYDPSGCNVNTCASVTVSLVGGSLNAISPFLPAQLPLPTASSYLTREALLSRIDGVDNPSCL